MLDFCLEVLWKSTAFLGVIALLSWSLKSRTAATRHFVLALGFVGLAAIPVLVRIVPKHEIVQPVRVPAVSRSQVRVSVASPEVATPPASSKVEHPEVVSDTSSRSVGWETILVAVYGLGVLVSLLGLGWRLLKARRLVIGGPKVGDAAMLESLDLACRQMGVDDPVDLRFSPVPVPMTLGLLRPVVLIPSDAKEWSTDRLDTVLRHECAHIRRHDWSTLVMARLIRAFYWFHPLIWWAETRLRAESEVAVDDLVVLSGRSAPDYAQDLIDMASRVTYRSTRSEAMAVVEHGTLKARIQSILGNTRRGRAIATETFLFVTVLVVVGLSVFAAAHTVQGPETVSNGRYYLGNGRWIEILAITDMHGPNPRSWDANGKLLDEPLIVDRKTTPFGERDLHNDPQEMVAGTRYVLLRTDLDGDVGVTATAEPSVHEFSSWFYERPAPKGYGLGFSTILGGANMLYRFDFTRQDRGSINVLTPVGPYESRYTASVQNGQFVNPSDAELGLQLQPQGAGFLITANLPTRWSGDQVMVIATVDGKESRTLLEAFATGPQKVLELGDIQKLQKVELRSRPMRRIVFDNVPLQPNSNAKDQNILDELPHLVKAEGPVAHLPGGKDMELIGASEWVGNTRVTWDKDGRTIPAAQVPTWVRAPKDNVPPLAGYHKVSMLFRIPKTSEGAPSTLYGGDGFELASLGTTTIGTPEPNNYMFQTVLLANAANQTDVVVRTAVGAYTTVAQEPLKTTGDYRSWFVPATPTDSDNAALHVVAPQTVMEKVRGGDFSAKLLDARGQSLKVGWISWGFSDGELSFHVSPEDAKRAKTIQIQTRPYVYLRWKKVALKPRG